MVRHHHGNDSSVNTSAPETRRETTEAPVKGMEAQEETPVLQWEALSDQQVQELLEKNEEELQTEMQEILGFRNPQTCMKESALLDYYVCGFWWAKQAGFTSTQTSFVMVVLHMLMTNIEDKGMAREDNMRELTTVMATACDRSPSDRSPSDSSPSDSSPSDSSPLLNRDEATALLCYTKNSLFQRYRLYKLLFTTPREELQTGMKRTIEVFGHQDSLTPLEEGIPTHLCPH
ncbi:ciliary-associated calcium-binding coiled-coil protein 1 [Antennarius striatus]|uniref:ciliary-associated calcium-binding coiled-coil protein 1 n=1 Tax=Antennarius striatus TaxID=241820 RepID=UPI0035AECE94